ncbi:hypothetical protein V6Z11_A06G198000 [Gossypium hirsutum]
MGKKGSWFTAVKKVLSLEPNKDEKIQKSKKNGVKLPEKIKGSKRANWFAPATTMVTGALVRLTLSPHYLGKSMEEIATVKIQTVFRGYLARKALRDLRGLERLKSLIQGQSVKRQATITLRCMRTLARVQSQTRTRQLRMSEQNRALQKHLQTKYEKQLQNSKSYMGEDWNVSTKSKEQMQAKQQYRQVAAMRRERALAYSFTHQRSWKVTCRSMNHTFMDPFNPKWSWSWLERWMSTRPWEIQNAPDNNDHGPSKSVGAEITKAKSQSDVNNDHNKRSSTLAKPIRPPNRRSFSTPPSKTHSISSKKGLQSPSPTRIQLPDRYKRHSIGGLSLERDDEVFANSPPSNKIPAHSSSKDQSRSPSINRNPVNTRRHSGPPKVDIFPN